MDLLDLVQMVDKVAVPQVVLVVMKTVCNQVAPIDLLVAVVVLNLI